MNDQQWDDYIRRAPGTFWGEEGRKQDEAFWKHLQPAKPPARRPSAPPPSDAPLQSAAASPTAAPSPSGKGDSVVGFIFALLGFFAGVALTYSEANPDSVAPFFAGLVGGYLAAKLYKLLLVLALIAFVVHLVGQP